jgi:two-component sensor histidine kinase
MPRASGGSGGAGEAGEGARPARSGSRRGVSIHVVIVALVVALVAPAVGFLAYIVHVQNRDWQREVGARGARIAGEIADRLEQEITTLETMLAVFATSGWLEDDELPALHRRASNALAGTDRFLILLDEDFEQLLNTRVPYGEPLGKTSDAGTAAEVLRRGQVMVSNVFEGRVAGTAVFNVLRPVRQPNGSRRLLILTRNADSLVDLFGQAMRNSGWSFAVLDRVGEVVSAHHDPREEGRALPDACTDAGAGGQAVAATAGAPHIARRQVGNTGWTVCAWVDVERLDNRMERSWTTVLTAIVAWLGAALLAAVLLSASISRAIASTARVGEALEAGREVPIASSFVTEIDEVRSYLAGAASERIRRDERLQLLLREMAHRAKNQLALAVSLVGLSARSAASAADLKEDLTGRLLALGRSIDAVTGKELDAAPLGELIRLQLEPFVDADGDRLEMRGDPMPIPESAAQSLSLVLHELATNASKHGAWSRPSGKVQIHWRVAGSTLMLEWSETGGAARRPERKGFGTTLVDTLVGTGLGGKIHRNFGDAGFRCRLALPLDRLATGSATGLAE